LRVEGRGSRESFPESNLFGLRVEALGFRV